MTSRLVYADEVISTMNQNYVQMFTSMTDSRAAAVEAIGSLIIDLSQELSKSNQYYTFDLNVFMIGIQGYVNATMEEQAND